MIPSENVYLAFLKDIASGSSVDWVKEMKAPNLTYTYELRDDGWHEFWLPEEDIIDNSIEVFASVAAMLKEGQRRGIA